LNARVVMILRVTLLFKLEESGSDSLVGFPAGFNGQDYHDILPAGLAFFTRTALSTTAALPVERVLPSELA
jgi:hypothetical protein